MSRRGGIVDVVAELPVVFPVRPVVTAYIAVLAAGLLVSGLHLLRTGVMWTLADWLINYQGGFVRRGLLGEVAFRVSALTHAPLLATVLAFGVLAYLTFFMLVWSFVRPLRWNFWYLLLIFSPVTLQFPLVSTSAFHKEIFLFASFAGLLQLLRARHSDAVLVPYMSAVGTGCVLTHEPFVLYAPYVVCATYLHFRDARRLFRLLWPPLVCCQAAFILAATHPGNQVTADRICASLGGTSPNLCQGSIHYLTYSATEAHADVVQTMSHFRYWTFYPCLALFALVPFSGCFLYLRRHGLPRDVQYVLLLSFACSALLTVPLFFFATDWGRWVHMHCMLLFLLLVEAGLLHGVEDVQPDPCGRWELVPAAATVALLVHSTCWSLPGYSSFPKAGYISTAKRVTARAKYNQVF